MRPARPAPGARAGAAGAGTGRPRTFGWQRAEIRARAVRPEPPRCDGGAPRGRPGRSLRGPAWLARRRSDTDKARDGGRDRGGSAWPGPRTTARTPAAPRRPPRRRARGGSLPPDDMLRCALQPGAHRPEHELLGDIEIGRGERRPAMLLDHRLVPRHQSRHGRVLSASLASASSQESSASQRSTSRAR